MQPWIHNFRNRFFKHEAAHLVTGKWGEAEAARYLKAKGYRIIEKRARVGKRDEIDLVTQQDKVLVFVEVKTRSRVSDYRPAAAVDRRKQKALSRAAATYVGRMKTKPEVVRFDVIEVIGETGSTPEINHIEQAFKMSSFRSMKWS